MKKRILAAILAAVMMVSMASMLIMPTVAEEVNEALGSLVDEYAKYDFALFTQGEAMASLYERAQAVDADAAALLAEEKNIEKKLKNTYPHYVPYAQKEVYAAYTSGVKDWAITCAADWRAAVASKKGFSGETLHLTNDIDMENINVEPMCPAGLTFAGTLNGHGYCFRNLLIEWDLAKGNYVGLIGYSHSGKVYELGLANGLVRAYGNQTTEAKVASLMGEGDHVTLRHCWNGVTVDSTGGDKSKGQTTSGLARTRGNAVIDGCFNVGVVKGLEYSGTLCGYNQSDTKIYNSFAIGTALGTACSFVRYAVDGKVVNALNSYCAGNSGVYCHRNVSVDVSAYMLSADAYQNGELAWKLNHGMAGSTVTYYTVKDGKTVFGTAENQTRRVSMVMEGGETKYLYASAGEQVYLNHSIGASYSGEGLELIGNLLVMPAEDVTVTVTPGDLDYNALQIALAKFDKAHLDLLKNSEAVLALLDEVQEHIKVGYADQASIDADTAALVAAFVYESGDKMPSVTKVQEYPYAPGYSVSSLAELEYVAKNLNEFGMDDVIYLAADITVSEDSPANKMQLLPASIDGLNHTISGIRVSGDAWLGDYAGKSIKNLRFEDCHATNQPWQGALLIKNLQTPHLVLENLSFYRCSASKGSGNGLSLMVGIQNKYNTTEMYNIRVEECTLNRGTSGGNSGFLMGREQCGTLIAENCYLKNNTLTGSATSGTGVAFGEVTGTASCKDIGIFNTVAEGNAVRGALIGAFKNCDSGTGPGILDVENIYSGNNCLAALVYRGNTTGVIRLGKAYSEQEGLVGSGGAAVSSRESLVGGAYALNHAGVEKKWEFPAEGDAPVWDTDGEGLPVRVIFTAGDLEENYFTDTEGKLVGLDDGIFQYAVWKEVKDFETLQKMTFTEDQHYIGSLGQTYKVMSQNLCVWGGNDKKPYMIELVNMYAPDFILMQEGNEAWVEYLKKNLKGYTLFYKYRYVNNLESCPIAWKTDKYEEVEKGYFWISDTPDKESLGWDGGCYRIVTWAALKEKATGQRIVISSFHLDHQGKIAREKGGPLVYDRLLELRERYPGSMFFTAADFNCGEGSIAYNAMIQENLEDCRYVAAVTTTRPTYGNGLAADWTGVGDKNRIDFMMTDITTAKVTEFQVLEEIFGKTETNEGTRLSDHNGLLATVVSMATEKAYCAHEWTVADNGDGTHRRTCTAGCGHSVNVAHSDRYTKKDGVTHGTKCIYCNVAGEEACTLESVVTKATCTEAGYTTHSCNDCKYFRQEAGEAASGHAYVWNDSVADYRCTCGTVYAVKDANGDKALNIADATALMQYLIGIEVELDRMAADYCRDNRITIADVVAVLRLLSQ